MLEFQPPPMLALYVLYGLIVTFILIAAYLLFKLYIWLYHHKYSLFLIGLFLIMPTISYAQQQAPNRIGGSIGRVLDKAQGIEPTVPVAKGGLFEAIEQITIDDLKAAIALAELPTGPGGQGDDSAKLCYGSLLNYIELKQKFRDEQGGDEKEKVIAKFQRARNLVRMLDTDSPVRRACAAFAADVKSDVKQLIGGLATGVALKALTIP